MASINGKPESPFLGLWHIASMSSWDDNYINEEVQAFFEFEANDNGHFQFGLVEGYMKCCAATRDGESAVDWTWEGNIELDPAQGRGWAMIKDGELHGMIFIRCGHQSGFMARRVEKKKIGSLEAVDQPETSDH